MKRVLPLLVTVACGTVPYRTSTLPPAHFGADLHAHVTMRSAAVPLFQGEPGQGPLAPYPRARLQNQMDVPTLRRAGIEVFFAALWPPFRLRPERSALDEALHQVQRLEEFSSRQPTFALVHSVTEARRAMKLGRLAMFAQVEGGEGIASVEDVDHLYAAGVRCLTLTHFESNALGGAAKGQLARSWWGIHTSEVEAAGLSDLGRAVVARMMALGILIDVSHSSDRTIGEVLQLTSARGVPVIASHTGARALMPDLERNLSDQNALGIAIGGGLIGVSLYEAQVETPRQHQTPGHQAGTCDDVVAHWRYLSSLVGPESVVLGSDWNGFIVRPRAGGACVDGLRHAGDLPALWASLTSQRVVAGSIAERVLQLMERVEAKADPVVQSFALAAWK
jgi:membrane dipeptidase